MIGPTANSPVAAPGSVIREAGRLWAEVTSAERQRRRRGFGGLIDTQIGLHQVFRIGLKNRGRGKRNPC